MTEFPTCADLGERNRFCVEKVLSLSYKLVVCIQALCIKSLYLQTGSGVSVLTSLSVTGPWTTLNRTSPGEEAI